MKKWHLEGIISVTNINRRKLVVPDSNHMYLWSTAYSHKPSKELWLVTVLRNVITFFLRGI